MYEDINDYELLDNVADNEIATESLFIKYKPLINNIATKAYYKNQLNGVEINDLIQEGMIGLNIAINTFDDSKEASFFTFARLCIIRRILSSIIAMNRQKNQILNESISVEDLSEDKGKEKVFSDYSSDPENMVLSDENAKEFVKNVEKSLTNLECEVFELKTAGFDYKEIADLLDKDVKSIDNAISRIKTKINKLLQDT